MYNQKDPHVKGQKSRFVIAKRCYFLRRVFVPIFSVPLFFLTTGRPCVFMLPPFGESPRHGQKKMENIKNSNYGFWFYYFYAPVCPLLRRT